jgi:hypothetical protein
VLVSKAKEDKPYHLQRIWLKWKTFSWMKKSYQLYGILVLTIFVGFLSIYFGLRRNRNNTLATFLDTKSCTNFRYWQPIDLVCKNNPNDDGEYKIDQHFFIQYCF